MLDRSTTKKPSSPVCVVRPISLVISRIVLTADSSIVCCTSLAPPPPIFQGCDDKDARGVSSVLMKSLTDPSKSVCALIADQTCPCAGSFGVVGSPRIPRTVRTTPATGARLRPNSMAVGTPCPGIYAPEQSTICVKSRRGSTSSINFEPNSRFIKLLATMSPTNPASVFEVPDLARSKNRSMNGAPSA
jgi:hypothetical protein